MKVAIKFLLCLNFVSMVTFIRTTTKILSFAKDFKVIQVDRGAIDASEPISNSKNVHEISNATKILLVAYLRSGSTFTGDLLQSTPGSFFTFEPLVYIGDDVLRINQSSTDLAFELLDGLFECKLSLFETFHNRFKRYSRFKMSKFFMRSCLDNPRSCATPAAVRGECLSSQTRVTKVVRLPMESLYQMMTKNPRIVQEWQIVHLRRDPRGMYHSRSSRPWCEEQHCLNVTQMCQEMREDFMFANLIEQNVKPVSFVRVLYDRLATKAKDESRKLFKNLGIEYSPETEEFISSHIKTDNFLLQRHPHSTIRNSVDTAKAWRHKLDTLKIKQIENECGDILRELGLQKMFV